MSRAIVLGSGTSNGVPMLGIRYADSFLANPKNHRTRASLLLQGPGGNVLIDCAPEMRLQLLRHEVYEIEAVVITHTHADHVMGMDDLRSFCIVAKRDMPVYTLPQYQEDIRRIFSYAFREFPPGIEVPRFDLRPIGDRMELAGLEMEIFVVPHGSIPVIAFRTGDFAYFTDVSDVPESVIARLGGLRTLILDAVRYAPHPNHLHFDAAIATAERIGAKTTYFTHLSHDYDHDEVEAGLPSHIRLAYDGLDIPIGAA